MKPFRWSSEKNELLAAQRGITFERVVVAIQGGGLLDVYRHPNSEEKDLLKAYERGEFESVATPGELARIRESARATGTKDRRINIRLSSGELSALQTRALQEGMPYQTLISSVLHKYVTGRLVDVDDARFTGLDRTASQERGTRSRPST